MRLNDALGRLIFGLPNGSGSVKEKKVDTSRTKIGGFEWRAVKRSTIEHQFFTMKVLLEAGLGNPRKAPTETPEDFATRLLNQLILSGQAFLLLGCLLIPEHKKDADWSPEMANETATLIKALSDDEDITAVKQALIGALISFFKAGLTFSNLEGA